jgi:hypothetical protein
VSAERGGHLRLVAQEPPERAGVPPSTPDTSNGARAALSTLADAISDPVEAERLRALVDGTWLDEEAAR